MRLLVFALLLSGCGDGFTPATPDVSSAELELEESDGRHWHERYVEDNCRRCPDCCITVVASDDGAVDTGDPR
jgi:hypothetical protein